MTLKELLSTLNGVDIKVMIKDMDLNNICKIHASAISQLNTELADRTVEKWSILRNNFIAVYLENLETVVRVTGLELDKDSLTLHVGEPGEIIPIISPEDATVNAIIWESDNETIATVENGIITPLEEGIAIITATTVDGGYSATCILVVEAALIPVQGISLSQEELILDLDSEDVQLEATIIPEDANNKEVVWNTSDENVVTVVDGLVHVVGVGNAVITVVTQEGEYFATCAVTVNSEVIPVLVPVQGVSISQEDLALNTDSEDVQLEATVSPEDATNKETTWSSSDENVATVVDGLVHVVGIGNAIITVTTVDGEYSATCSITVSESEIPISEISLNTVNIEMNLGDEDVTLTPTIVPENATGNIIWSSDDPTIVTVRNGVIHAEGVGNTTVTVMSELDNSIRAVCSVTVN